MKPHLTLILAMALSSGASAGENLDFLYEDVFVALKRQCSDSYSDMKVRIDDLIQEYVTTNAAVLSHDYLQRIEAKTPTARTYTREQCVAMSKIPKEPMVDVMKAIAKEREDEMRKRGEYERAHATP